MTIKSEKEIKPKFNINKWFSDHIEKIFGTVIVVMIIGLIISMFTSIFSTNQYTEDLAKDLVRSDYPAVMCLSGNGQFRIYESNTYTVAHRDVEGWNIWWTDKGHSGSTAFHLSKCEIK